MNLYEVVDLNTNDIYFVIAENIDEGISKTKTRTKGNTATRSRCLLNDINTNKVYKYKSAANGFDTLFRVMNG